MHGLLHTSHMHAEKVEAAVCTRRATVIECDDSVECDNECLAEGAFQGICERRGSDFGCFCFFDC